MISTIVKLLGSEAAISTASTINGNQLIRVYNQNATDVLLTVTAPGAVITGTCTVKAGETIFVRKTPVETITAATACKMVAVSF